jgi:TonB-dependent starch-binding outer membrane protein SusC
MKKRLLFSYGRGLLFSHKKFLTMKLSCLLLILNVITSVASTVYSQRVSLNLNNAKFSEAMSEISKQTNLEFAYSKEIVDLDRNVSISASNADLRTVMDHLLNGTQLVHAELNGKIYVGPKAINKAIESAILQKTKITGTIKDASTGEPLIGVNVVVDGTTTGVVSDINGNYSIESSKPDAVLVFSYVGYRTLKVTPQGNKADIQLVADVQNLDEVVVIGYGVQKKSVVTASIARVTSDDLSKVAPIRIDDALKGITSGVTVTTASGQPGAGSQIRIRGIGSTTNSDPLYVVDGMVIEGGIDYLNPNDIKSVEVLKDAASGAIYGARAANGVVLVTTKSGQSGKIKVSYDFSYGIQNPWKHRSVLNGTQYGIMMNEASINAGQGIMYSDPYSLGNGTDWQKEVFDDNAPRQQHQLSISGGNDRSNYYVSFGYFGEDGIVGGNFNRSNYRRYTLRSNTEQVLLDAKDRNYLNHFVFTQNISYANTHAKSISTNSEYGSPLGSALVMTPLMDPYADTDAEIAAVNAKTSTPVYDSRNGKLLNIAGDDFNEITNPIGQLSLPGSTDISNKIVANFSGELTLWDNLKFKSSFGNDIAFWENDGYNIAYYLGKSTSNARSSAYSTMNRGWGWQLENTLSYDKKIDKHGISVVLGQSGKKATGRYLSGTRYLLTSNDPSKANIDYATGLASNGDQSTSGSANSPVTWASYFGRLSYNYDERYMLQATVRRDGSSKFGENNKWATFPSVSLGWNITNESFVNDVKPEWLYSAKLRASWGKNGQANIGDFKYAVLTSSGNNYTFGAGESATITNGVKPSGTPNPDLKWEESEQTDVGLDLGFFKNSLTFTADYYVKKTSGMLIEMPVPSYLGESKPTGNVGAMTNSGLEFEANYRFKVSDWNFSVGANASYLHNKVTNIGNSAGYINLDSYANVGTISREENGICYPFFYGKKTAGIFQNMAEVNAYTHTNSQGITSLIQPNARPGDVRFVDINNDGVIDDNDRTKIGKGMPDWTYGFNLSVSYKNFDLNAVFQGTIGNDIYDATRRTDLKYVNLPSYMWSRWTGEGTSNKIPRFSWSDTNGNWLSSDLFVKNGSYLRLKNIQLGYTLPKGLTQKVLISSLRIYVAAENLLTFTKYEGFDPEVGTSGGTSIGIDRGCYPQARTFTFGVNVNL